MQTFIIYFADGFKAGVQPFGNVIIGMLTIATVSAVMALLGVSSVLASQVAPEWAAGLTKALGKVVLGCDAGFLIGGTFFFVTRAIQTLMHTSSR
ncbi:MAG: hypothetical protein EKK46_08990 [Rhodocyclaceae bacterium]|nr:MAG: hypothetical protein EKK46_08990 [Rhodocyclaceae bacterium]